MDGLYYGTIQQVFPPGSPQNLNKYQYEYSLVVTTRNYSQMPIQHAIKSDAFGAPDDFDDATLDVNQKVLVMFARAYSGLVTAIIIGAIRNSPTITAGDLGYHWLRRFNRIEQRVDKDGNFSVESDEGPNLRVNTASVVLDDSVGEQIVLDKQNKILTLKGNALSVIIEGDANVQIKGKATVSCASLEATVGGAARLTSKSLEANVSGEAKVNATGKCQVNGSEVDLNGSVGNVVTTATHPTDYVTGIPIMGSTKVKAG
jgi:hypothetical protein